MMQCVAPDQGCVGCSACYAVCPKSAIRMVKNIDGFYVPKVDESLCVSCGHCVLVCPLKQQLFERDIAGIECLYAFVKDTQSIKGSTSGGVASMFAMEALRRGGIACGCCWDENFVAHHVCTDDAATVASMRGSKYVQSNMENCFCEIKQALEADRFVLFTGTPCQTTALHSFLHKPYPKLITCALICGGVPSPKVLDFYIQALEKKFNSKLTFLNMRSKIKGWIVPHIEARFANRKVFTEVLLTRNLYGINFGQGLFLNENCMHCHFKLDTVQADIMIGDHWGMNRDMLTKSGNNGASVILALTQRGNEFVRSQEDLMTMDTGNLTSVIKSHHVLTKDHVPNANRDDFFAAVNQENIMELLEKYYHETTQKNPVKKVLYEFLHRSGLYSPLYTMRWKLKNRGN